MTVSRAFSPSLEMRSRHFSSPQHHRLQRVVHPWRGGLPLSAARPLVEAHFGDSPWRLFLCTVLLTKTRATQALPVLLALLQRYPTPLEVLREPEQARVAMVQMLRAVGLAQQRATRLVRLAQRLQDPDAEPWTDPLELPGVGRYGRDAFLLFAQPAACHLPAPTEAQVRTEGRLRGGASSTSSSIITKC